MSITNASIKTGATWSSSGGSDLAFVPDGRSVPNGLSLVVSSDTNLATRRTLAARATLPALPASSSSFAKLGRNELVYKVPFLATDGRLYIQTIRISTGFHADYTAKDVRLGEAVGLLADSDFADFWTKSLLA